jgi:integrase/recombinase XerD
MSDIIPATRISPLRQRLIDDMTMRRFSHETRRSYIRDVGRFATFMGRSPDTATAEDLRRFQVEQHEAGVPVPTMNSIVSALRFFFTQTLDRPDLARRLVRVTHPRKLPVVLNPDEVARLLSATTCLKHQAALSVGRCHRNRHARRWPATMGHDLDVVCSPPVPTRRHPARSLALPALHAELS